MIGALKLVYPLICHFDNGHQLPIICGIAQYSGRAVSSVVHDRVRNPKSVVLVRAVSDSKATWIGLQNDRFLRLEMVEDRGFSKSLFELSQWKFVIPSQFPLPQALYL